MLHLYIWWFIWFSSGCKRGSNEPKSQLVCYMDESGPVNCSLAGKIRYTIDSRVIPHLVEHSEIHKIVFVGRILLHCVVPENTHTLQCPYHQRLLYIQKRGGGVGSTNQILPWRRHADWVKKGSIFIFRPSFKIHPIWTKIKQVFYFLWLITINKYYLLIDCLILPQTYFNSTSANLVSCVHTGMLFLHSTLQLFSGTTHVSYFNSIYQYVQ